MEVKKGMEWVADRWKSAVDKLKTGQAELASRAGAAKENLTRSKDTAVHSLNMWKNEKLSSMADNLGLASKEDIQKLTKALEALAAENSRLHEERATEFTVLGFPSQEKQAS